MKIDRLHIFDTEITSENLGDSIIMNSVDREISEIFTSAHFTRSATHEVISKVTHRLVKNSSLSIVGGSNLLSSNMNRYNQWKLRWKDVFFLQNIVLVGVGWWQYQRRPNLYTRWLLKNILSKDFFHSVRDEYTKEVLKSIGIVNVINTSCATMWKLNQEHCSHIPNKKGSKVIFTLTDYNQDPMSDKQLLMVLMENYPTVYFWPQGTGDLKYLSQLCSLDTITLLNPTLEAFDNKLITERIDYCGTRLHAGIRALQFKRRSIIIGIDNRAKEKQRDFNLPVLPREEIVNLGTMINTTWTTEISIPEEDINLWKNQFS